MGKHKLSLLIRQLKVAVKKMQLLLRLWRVHSSLSIKTRSSSSPLRRWRSFSNDGERRRRRTSYYGYSWEEDDDDYNEKDDINKRAENFIANFRRQLSMERDMELKYCTSCNYALIEEAD
ncbi:cotton fiber protein [Senna tora]|uniref:Cotton fiber protein n=1 Tax=Senna tora TaxID=362788 RepID=A0A835CFW9_9FABA|nr:cotton fiber protein [Senna tora]